MQYQTPPTNPFSSQVLLFANLAGIPMDLLLTIHEFHVKYIARDENALIIFCF